MASPAPSAGLAANAAGIPVAAGDVIADKYVIERVIGSGGVGVVVAARHRGLDERVAIKFLQRSAAESSENLARFAREARALARIKSENVARVMDTGSLPTGEPFMVMELIEGQDLAAVLKSRSRLPVVEAVDYVVQACEALAVAHGLDIIHRDIKPANLFLSRAADGTPIVKVLDFGISKLAGGDGRDQAVTQTLSVIGSPLYMSPEQMERPRDADARSDIWSLGVILYELIAGKPPFAAATMPMLCARICTSPPTPLADHDVEVPADLAAAIARCLEKSPERRFASVASLARAIAPFGFGSTLQKAEHVARIARAEGLPTEPETMLSDELSSPPAVLARDAAADVDRQPESLSPRRLAWDSSAPPPPVQPRRLRLTSGLIVALFVLLSLAVWMQRGRDGRSVARPAARTLAAHDGVSQLDTGSGVTPRTEAAQPTPKIAPLEDVSTAGKAALPEPRPQAAQATQGERPRLSTPRSKTPPSVNKPASPAKPAGRHDDVLSER